jgi:hypothetical protein
VELAREGALVSAGCGRRSDGNGFSWRARLDDD